MAGFDIQVPTPGNSISTMISENIKLEASNLQDGIRGIYFLNGNRFLHATGDFGNVFLGQASGNFGATGAFVNTAIGEGTMQNLSFNSANYNTAVGGYSQQSAQIGGYNTSVGAYSLQVSSSGQYNVAIGCYTMQTTNTNYNTAVGYNALPMCGTNNIALGFQAGVTYTGDENSNITIGNSGVAHEQNTIRIGNTVDHASNYTAGIANVSVSSPQPVFINPSNNQLGSALPNSIITEFDDFLGSVGDFAYTISKLSWENAGHLITGTLPSAGHDGVVQTTGDGQINGLILDNGTGNRPFLLGGGELSVNWVINIETLSDNVNTYELSVGVSDTHSGEPGDGVYFFYTDSVNSGNWTLKTCSATTKTAQDSGVAVTTGWVNLGVKVNAAASSVTYFINGVQVGTPITTNIPAGAIGPSIAIQPTAGNGSVIQIDLMYYSRVFTTPR